MLSRSRARSESLTALLFLAPSLAGFAVLSAVPILGSLVLSLTSWDGLRSFASFGGIRAFLDGQFIGADNYSAVAGSEEFRRVLGNTFYFIALYLPGILLLSLGAALVLNRKLPGATVFRVLFYIPVLTSWVAGSLVWKWVLSPEYGVVNGMLASLGLPGPGWLFDDRWAMPGIVLASLWKDVGFFGLILLGGLQGIDPSYYEAAELDGAGSLRRVLRITLPLLSPTIFFVVIIAVVNSIQLFPQVMVMMTSTGISEPRPSTQVLVERIYRYAFRYYKMGYAAAFSWILFAIVFALTAVQLRLQKIWVHYES
ncbi:MAG: sugar ABC transporter permease [Treponema sp. GWB1_62_6]|nr:MAG: sugar ABC transporter permease [Treponema sp. GWC1_61_84]OHE67905.1 MAG: sugar ABC transporter permease [Treponema sp. GWB1_62_6]HCM25589.1 sugar ABC transporter permease [Treponema sp.]